MQHENFKLQLAGSINDNWSPEQALAVVELFDDLRRVIWIHYQLQLHEQLQCQRCTSTTPPSYNIDETDPLFCSIFLFPSSEQGTLSGSLRFADHFIQTPPEECALIKTPLTHSRIMTRRTERSAHSIPISTSRVSDKYSRLRGGNSQYEWESFH